MTEIILTIPEIAALAAGGDDPAQRAMDRLELASTSDEVAQAGVCSLYARGLLEGDVDSQDELQPVQMVLATVSLLAECESEIRFAVGGGGSGEASRLYVRGAEGILVTPVGFGCLHVRLVDASPGPVSLIQTAAVAALADGDHVFLVSAANKDGETSLALRRVDQGYQIASSSDGAFTSFENPWDEVAARIG